LKLLRNNKRALRVSTLADLLINALYDKGEAIKKKHMVYAIAIENRDLIRYLK
jgi:ribosomal protein S7